MSLIPITSGFWARASHRQ